MTESEDLYQIAILIDQLKHEDVQLRANAFKNIETIAAALGAERTKEELIPFIADSMEDEDDVLIIIAENIEKLIGYIGSRDFLHVLLQPLQYLLSGEDNDIRDKALTTAESLVRQMDRQQINSYILPLMKDLANRDWYTARSASALLAPCVFAAVDQEQRRAILQLLSKASSDVTPNVRRSVARSLHQLAPFATPSQLQEMAVMYSSLATDEQDSIRIQSVQASVLLALYFNTDLQTKHIIQCCIAWASDRSWRVRWSLGHHLHDIVASLTDNRSIQLHPGQTRERHSQSLSSTILGTLTSVYESLINDAEPEVRASAVSHFSAFAYCLPRESTCSLLSSLQRLAGDSSDFVRAAAASELSLICSHLTKEDVLGHVLPSLLLLLRDERSEVRLNIIAHLHAINEAIGIESLSQSLLPALTDLGMDAKWRVRLAVIDHMPIIAKQLGENYFSSQLVTLCLHWLSDRVYYVRKAAAASLCKLTVIFGAEWATGYIIPALNTMRQTSASSQRLTILTVASTLLHDASMPLDSSANKSLLAIVLELANDPIANVRLTAATTLGMLSSSKYNRSDIVPVLKELVIDSDRDVRFYAIKALEYFSI